MKLPNVGTIALEGAPQESMNALENTAKHNRKFL
jgi:hypothetical protein